VLGVAVLALAACSGSAAANHGNASDPPVQAVAASGAAAAAQADPAADEACNVVTMAQVEQALGVLGAEHVAGPEVIGTNKCAWHSSDPNCLMRTLGIEIMSGPQAQAGYAATKAAAALRDEVAGVGQQAFASTDLMPFGTGAQVDRLNVQAGGVWLKLTTAGRVGDSGRDILTNVATEVLASPNLTGA
jgi:hypothetical protein